MFDYAIIGGGVVGLATAMALGREKPRTRVVVLEKEGEIARHQTGRNSGVIHSGICYKPGSYKAKMAAAGNRSMVELFEAHGIEASTMSWSQRSGTWSKGLFTRCRIRSSRSWEFTSPE